MTTIWLFSFYFLFALLQGPINWGKSTSSTPAVPKKTPEKAEGGADSAPSIRARKKTSPKALAASKATKAEVDKMNGALETAAKYLASLKELTPNGLWRSCVRSNEVDRRLGREANVLESLSESLSANLPQEAWLGL